MPIGHGVSSTVGQAGAGKSTPALRAEGWGNRSLRAYETLLNPCRLEKLRGYGTGATVPQTATGGLG